MERPIVTDKINEYKELLRDPFPLLKRDLEPIILRDSYNLFLNGSISDNELSYIRKEVL